MALLVRLEAQDADNASAPAASLFVRCKKEDGVLRLLLAEGDALWRATVAAAQKPAALACSGADFLRTLHATFSVADDASTSTSAATPTAKPFTYKWSRACGSLTFMEPSASSFAMKYATLALERVGSNRQPVLWTELLREIVDNSERTAKKIAQQRSRLAELEALLREKDALLDTALRAKQQLEDQLFSGFCAAQAATAFNGERATSSEKKQTTTTKKSQQKQKPGARTRAKGAKLRHQVKNEGGSEDGGGKAEDSDPHDQSTGDDDDNGDEDDDSRARSRLRSQLRGEVEAYSQLPSPMRSASQVCTADDVLSDLDAIMKDEVAANDDAIRSASSRSRRPRAVAAPPRATTLALKKRKSEDPETEEPPASRRSKKTPKPAAAPVVKAAVPTPVDSEEEDILDMLA
ncbi:hypothetical protein PybrP1_006476 [[Pythium] brassicae (nom. inval.)]|nr:hypothetical protein PybrP1_006476 [[Pythium] brassicae (nom. inval.)]